MQVKITETLETMIKKIIKELFNEVLRDFHQQIAGLQEPMTWFNEKIEEIKLSVNAHNIKIESLQTDNNSLKSECLELKKELCSLIKEKDSKDQWVRRSNIEIVGIPEKKNENLLDLVNKLAKCCGYNINPSLDLDFVTRVAVKTTNEHKKPKPNVIKLQARYKKDEFLYALRKIKDLTASDLSFTCDNKVYANDHLTTKNKYLLRRAKQLAKENNYTMCWVRNCTIMVRRKADSPIIYINTEDDLKKINCSEPLISEDAQHHPA
ncbi:uncharacterized protein LOC126976059 [Leptidea sinapis]|uniref:uncharacterized protein LOC126976059 n=1 Tax=Leptidea sinapis TaxID=189913 RepID=UPI0021C3006E|nr:uncharacterized protein LOC126976059 [Leptidea sinapis]